MLTELCNRNCPYCFAKNRMEDSKNKDYFISLANVKKIITFLKKSKIKQVGFIGGEPTLHPFFKKILTIFTKQKFNVLVFTNGVVQKNITDFLAKKQNIAFLLNLNELKTYSRNEKQKLFYFMKKLNKNITLGFNFFYKHQTLDFFIPLMDRFNLARKIRIGFTIPLGEDKNICLGQKDHRIIINYLSNFSKICFQNKIKLISDCGLLNLCDFSDKQLGMLYKNASYIPSTSCDILAPFDIGLNLEVWRCFGLSELNVKLKDFQNLDSLKDNLNAKLAIFKKVGLKKKCLCCTHLKTGKCYGGCVAAIFNSFKPLESNEIYRFKKGFKYRIFKSRIDVIDINQQILYTFEGINYTIFLYILKGNSLNSIVTRLGKLYKTNKKLLEKDLKLFIKQLKNNGILK